MPLDAQHVDLLRAHRVGHECLNRLVSVGRLRKRLQLRIGRRGLQVGRARLRQEHLLHFRIQLPIAVEHRAHDALVKRVGGKRRDVHGRQPFTVHRDRRGRIAGKHQVTGRIGIRHLEHVQQLVVAFGRHLRQHLAEERGTRGVIVLVSHHRATYGVGTIVFVEVREHHVEQRRQHQRERDDPHQHVALAHQHANGMDEQRFHDAPLVAQLAAGDFQEHIVERGWLGIDAAHGHARGLQRAQHVQQIPLASLARGAELAVREFAADDMR